MGGIDVVAQLEQTRIELDRGSTWSQNQDLILIRPDLAVEAQIISSCII